MSALMVNSVKVSLNGLMQMLSIVVTHVLCLDLPAQRKILSETGITLPNGMNCHLENLKAVPQAPGLLVCQVLMMMFRFPANGP